jgi:hypothetical protein
VVRGSHDVRVPSPVVFWRAGLSLEWFRDGHYSFFGLVLRVGSVFLMRVVARLREVWFSLNPRERFQRQKSFSRIKLGRGCVLRKKLALGSVRSGKPRIMPLQTTHRTGVYLHKPVVVPATQTTRPRLKQASTQFRDKAAR